MATGRKKVHAISTGGAYRRGGKLALPKTLKGRASMTGLALPVAKELTDSERAFMAENAAAVAIVQRDAALKTLNDRANLQQTVAAVDQLSDSLRLIIERLKETVRLTTWIQKGGEE